MKPFLSDGVNRGIYQKEGGKRSWSAVEKKDGKNTIP